MADVNRKNKDVPNDTLLIIATSACLLTLLPVAAHQLGLLRHLPDPPGRIFASDEITESDTAHPLGVPDSLPGLASYAATLALILMARGRPKARKLLALKLVADGAVAGYNVVRQVVTFGKICSWCTGTAIGTGLMLVAGRKVISSEAKAVRREF
ncbi:MAG: vitamin K epoxide reductase family protein [Nitrospirota bacterium]|nr:vitamin K epoxide reductase family protein [Nitrospirota bacterium]